MILYVLSVLTTISCVLGVVAKSIMFHQRDVAWWKAFIPFYNKYVLGKLCGHKVVGAIVGIFEFVWDAAIFVLSAYEAWIIQNYPSSNANGILYSQVPAELVNNYTICRIAFLVFMLAYMIIWCYLMNYFSKMHGKSKNWTILWALCPGLVYYYFAINPYIAMNGKQYKLEKVEIKSNERRK